jgi:hypothetical protein
MSLRTYSVKLAEQIPRTGARIHSIPLQHATRIPRSPIRHAAGHRTPSASRRHRRHWCNGRQPDSRDWLGGCKFDWVEYREQGNVLVGRWVHFQSQSDESRCWGAYFIWKWTILGTKKGNTGFSSLYLSSIKLFRPIKTDNLNMTEEMSCNIPTCCYSPKN